MPAVLLGEAAPIDSTEQEEASLGAADSALPDAATSDNGETDPGKWQ